ncbi:molecular chaperone [Buttiauxella sp. B2]|uniref:fimbrial biogenesis chaperone n=1 Tax=Buttiauxella sp. B2 TaxID=2587812 RepID=UPI00111D29E8|nr:molecular chaperone [Buttiauxella sp. B2]TNV20452.1 molecular chaperone [Buttiauxella sp. B2]
MRFIFFYLSMAITPLSYADNIIVNGTRFIYPAGSSEITIQMTNMASTPSLAQIWLDEGDPDVLPERISTPFIISPPIARIDSQNGQSIRIKKQEGQDISISDRESLWWLNILDVPAIDNNEMKDGAGTLNMAIRSRFKFIWRPAGLGDRVDAESKLELFVSGNNITIYNPSPFFITIVDIKTDSDKGLLEEGEMVAPKSKAKLKIKEKIPAGKDLVVQSVNDYGGMVETKITTHG